MLHLCHFDFLMSFSDIQGNEHIKEVLWIARVGNFTRLAAFWFPWPNDEQYLQNICNNYHTVVDKVALRVEEPLGNCISELFGIHEILARGSRLVLRLL